MSRSFLCCLPLLLLSSCAKTPNYGEQMIAHAESARTLAEQWRQGEQLISESKTLTQKASKLIASGNKNMKTGKKLISKAEVQISSGKSLLSDAEKKAKSGKEMMRQSEVDFQKQFPEKSLN